MKNIMYNSKDVVVVFLIVEEIGNANAEEIVDYALKQMNTTLNLDHVKVILERLRAKDILAIDSEKRYKIARIPAPWLSLKMPHLKKMRAKDFQTAVDEVERAHPQGAPLVEHKPTIGAYKLVDLTYECIDDIKGGAVAIGNGGDSNSKTDKLVLHRNAQGTPVIGAGQLRAWFRHNFRALNILNSNAHNWVGFVESLPLDSPPALGEAKAPIIVPGRGGCGIQTYETFKAGTKLKTYMRIPTRGIGFSETAYIDQLKDLFNRVEKCPLRGLGANPWHDGGRIRLLDIKEEPES